MAEEQDYVKFFINDGDCYFDLNLVNIESFGLILKFLYNNGLTEEVIKLMLRSLADSGHAIKAKVLEEFINMDEVIIPPSEYEV